MRKKKLYEKPQLKIVEIQLSECIAGSVPVNSMTVVKGRRNSMFNEVKTDDGTASWDSSF